MTNSNRPANRGSDSGLIAFDMGCLAVIAAAAGISALVGWVGTHHAAALEIAAAVAALGVICALVAVANRLEGGRPVRPPKGRLRVEATAQPAYPSLPFQPQPPPCLHPNTVPVNELDGPLREPGKLVAKLCLDCDTQLDPGWQPPAPAPAVMAVPAPFPPVPALVPGGNWHWYWHCTCGKAGSGDTVDEAAAQGAIRRAVAPHNRAGHRYEYRWLSRG